MDVRLVVVDIVVSAIVAKKVLNVSRLGCPEWCKLRVVNKDSVGSDGYR